MSLAIAAAVGAGYTALGWERNGIIAAGVMVATVVGGTLSYLGV